MDKITLSYGTGGGYTQKFIKEYVLKYFSNSVLNELLDSAVVSLSNGDRIAFTTDSYTVNPIFFPGGDIGKLSICGTINDLISVGAEAKFISLALIIEEGLELEIIEKIFYSIKSVSEEENVPVITGDTKVVEKGMCDKIFITTSGIGIIKEGISLCWDKISPGDKIVLNGTIGEHGFAILLSRGGFGFEYEIKSDCASLQSLVKKILIPELYPGLKFFRDITRGGIAAVLNEIVMKRPYIGIKIYEDNLPVSSEVKSISEILGIDYLYVANEGKMIFIVSPGVVEKVLELFHNHHLGKNAKIIGEITDEFPGKVVMKTVYGSHRIIDMPTAEQLPRIC